jgi:hypothetical protein
MSALRQKLTSEAGGPRPLVAFFSFRVKTSGKRRVRHSGDGGRRCFIAPPQTVHVTFISLRPLFFTRGNMEEESHGEEKEGQEEDQAAVKLQGVCLVLG